MYKILQREASRCELCLPCGVIFSHFSIWNRLALLWGKKMRWDCVSTVSLRFGNVPLYLFRHVRMSHQIFRFSTQFNLAALWFKTNDKNVLSIGYMTPYKIFFFWTFSQTITDHLLSEICLACPNRRKHRPLHPCSRCGGQALLSFTLHLILQIAGISFHS